MLTKVEIRPVVGSPVEVNTLVYPLHDFEPEIDLPDNEYAKMQATGLWPSFAYPKGMTVVMNGEILGSGASDAARASDTMTKRRALKDACLPPLTTTLTSRKHGVLRVRYDDMGEDADADYHCIVARMPLEALKPARCSFFITFKCFTPYFVGGSSTVYLP